MTNYVRSRLSWDSYNFDQHEIHSMTGSGDEIIEIRKIV